jgi:hypothetical protein
MPGVPSPAYGILDALILAWALRTNAQEPAQEGKESDRTNHNQWCSGFQGQLWAPIRTDLLCRYALPGRRAMGRGKRCRDPQRLHAANCTTTIY